MECIVRDVWKGVWPHIVRHRLFPHNGSETIRPAGEVLGGKMGINQMCAW